MCLYKELQVLHSGEIAILNYVPGVSRPAVLPLRREGVDYLCGDDDPGMR